MSTPPDPPPPDVVGLPADEATERCREAGWETVRTLEPDAIITLEHRPGRINLTVSDGTVARVHVG